MQPRRVEFKPVLTIRITDVLGVWTNLTLVYYSLRKGVGSKVVSYKPSFPLSHSSWVSSSVQFASQ